MSNKIQPKAQIVDKTTEDQQVKSIDETATKYKMETKTEANRTTPFVDVLNVIDKEKNGPRDTKVEKEMTSTSLEEVATEDDMRCGLGKCKPKGLQVFNNAKAFCAWLCWFGFLQGFMVNGVNNVNTSTIERRYELTSSKASMISISYDISAAIFAIPITYYGAHAHQPRMLTLAAMIMAVGAFVLTIPKIGSSLYDLNDNLADQCSLSNLNRTDNCGTEPRISMWLGVFIIGMILIGVGGTTLYSIGIVFLDSSVTTRSSPIYQGLFACSATLGPAVGYLLGGYFLEYYYVDFDKVDVSSINLSPSDPRFVGAWWIGFVVGSVLLLTVILLLVCYPRELPGSKEARLKSHSEVHQSSSNSSASREGFGKSWKDMPAALKILLTNPVYMCTILGGVCDGMLIASFATFMTKFIQNQFAMSAGTASIMAGLASVPGAAGGQIVGAVICKLAKLSVRGMLRLNIGLSVMVALAVSCVFLRCSSPSIAGVNVDYTASLAINEVELESSCNNQCGCTTLSYEPICGNDDIQYFSPCHGGCTTVYHSNDTKSFIGCSCIPTSTAPPGGNMATEGICDVDCTYFNAFLVLFCVTIFLIFLEAVPTLTIILRVVPESQRSFGIGVKWVLIRLLGTVPGPVMMGAVFDSTCVVWQEKCDKQGSCWIYDSGELSLRLYLMSLVVKVASVIFFIMALCFYKAPPKETEEELVSMSDNKGESNYGATSDGELKDD